MSAPCETVEAAAAVEIAKCIKNSGIKFRDFKLNPNAAEWKPTAEENRSLFITFPDRVAPSKTQIDYYFSRLVLLPLFQNKASFVFFCFCYCISQIQDRCEVI